MRWLGVDVGKRRIGLALTDPAGILASPRRTIRTSGSVATAVRALTDEIATISAEPDGLGAVVIGVPRHLDGRAHDETDHALALVERLRARVGLPVHVQDERLTSREAERRLSHTETNWRRRKERLDAAAAAVILQDFLDERPDRSHQDAERPV